jgi:hypothetical protein
MFLNIINHHEWLVLEECRQAWKSKMMAKHNYFFSCDVVSCEVFNMWNNLSADRDGVLKDCSSPQGQIFIALSMFGLGYK